MEEFDFNNLIPICAMFLKNHGEDVSNIRVTENMGQRYKIVTPIIEKMKQKGVAVDAPLLLNPSPSDVRNMLLSLLSKSDFGSSGKESKKHLSLSERIELANQERRNKILEDFGSDEWIHPAFIQPKKRAFRRISSPAGFSLDESEETYLARLKVELPNASLLGSLGHQLGLKIKAQNQAKLNFKEKVTLDLGKVIQENKGEYEKFLTRKIHEDNERAEAKTQNQNINALTDFEGKKKNSEALDDTTSTKVELTPEEIEKKKTEEFRKKKKEELDELNAELIKLQEQSNSLKNEIKESQKRSLEYKEEAKTLAESNEQITKDLKSKDIILNSLATENVIKEKQAEIQTMEAEMKEIEEAWIEAEDEFNQNLSRARRQFDERRTELENRQEKIDFYEENYSKLIQKIKDEFELRDQLIEEYKNMPKDMKREYLAQMIEETKMLCKENKETTTTKTSDLTKLNHNISKVDEELKYLSTGIETQLKEGESKKKSSDKSYDMLKEAFQALNKTFNSTRSYLTKYTELNVKNKQLQDKVMELQRNKYGQMTEGLRECVE